MPGEAIVIIRDKQWLVWLATTPEEIIRGLGGVPQIPAGTGMLFDLGAEQSITVTTVPMLFPIDIVFINSDLVVTEVAGSIAPGYLVTSDIPARYFLEVNAGEASGIQSGDQALAQVYQAVGQPDIMTPVIDLVATMVVFAFMFGMVRAMARAMLGKPQPKVGLYGPRGELLLPKTTKKVIFIGSCKPYRSDVTVEDWQERDRLGIWITDNRTGDTVAEWWDDEAREMFEQGFFKPGKQLKESVLDYAESVGLLDKGSSSSTVPAYLPQVSTATRLDSLQIVRAYKQVSRHGEDKISVSMQAWAIFPGGRKPHMISMYRSGDEYVISPLYAHVEHWVHVPVEKVRAWIKSLPVRHFEPMAVAPQYREEAERLAKQVDEPMDILPLPSRVIQPRLIGPRERRELPEEMEFFADSQEHIEHSMNHNGLRTKLDTAFQEAMARAKGGK